MEHYHTYVDFDIDGGITVVYSIDGKFYADRNELGYIIYEASTKNQVAQFEHINEVLRWLREKENSDVDTSDSIFAQVRYRLLRVLSDVIESEANSRDSYGYLTHDNQRKAERFAVDIVEHLRTIEMNEVVTNKEY